MLRIQIEPNSNLKQLAEASRVIHPDGIKIERVTSNPQMIVTPLSTFKELVEGFRLLEELVPWPGHDHETLYFDIETHSSDDRWNIAPREFFRLGQYSWGIHGEVVLTTDYDEMLSVIRSAYGVVGHNIHAYDLSVLFGVDSVEPLEMSMADRVFDTYVHANLVHPAPFSYTNRAGHTFRNASAPAQAFKWLSLDNQCFQFGVEGKEGDLKALAKEFGGFGLIPVSDERFRTYAEQDVVSLQSLTRELLRLRALRPYDWREQKSEAINAQCSRNGFTLNKEAAQARADELAQKKAELMDFLVTEYDFPTEGTMPWRSKKGKEVIFQILEDHGITPQTRPRWTKTATGNLSLGGDALIEVTKDTKAEELGTTLAQLQGQRSLAQLALDCVQDDGKVHPDITALQRSGRRSTLKPGLTVWSAHGAKAIEKLYFEASPGRKLVSMDYSAADNRAVAALSGDEVFMERFAPGGMKAHEITGRLMFGDEVYESDPTKYYNLAKPITHGGAYGAGAKTLAESSGLPVETTQRYLWAMADRYPKVEAWKNRVYVEGQSGRVVNSWGREMIIDPDRSFTQSPAMYGQSTTTEIFKDGLIKVVEKDISMIRWLAACVHDEAVWDIPEDSLHRTGEIRECMETVFSPSGGIPVDFPMSVGEPANNWMEASH